jgi:hypothetical protein
VVHDGPMTGTGSAGTKFLRVPCKIFDISVDQALKNVQMVKVTAKPCRSDNAMIAGTVPA